MLVSDFYVLSETEKAYAMYPVFVLLFLITSKLIIIKEFTILNYKNIL